MTILTCVEENGRASKSMGHWCGVFHYLVTNDHFNLRCHHDRPPLQVTAPTKGSGVLRRPSIPSFIPNLAKK